MRTFGKPYRLTRLSLALVALSLATACRPNAGMPPAASPVTQEAAHHTLALSGHVDFPERTVQLTTGGAVNQATVTLYNSSNQAIAVGRTDAAGNFLLDPGTAFAPATGEAFYLDAYKTATSNGVGSDVIRLRTVVAWGGSTWNSTSGATILLNAATTAVCVIQGLNAGSLSPKDTLNTVSGVTITTTVPAFADPGAAVNSLVTDLLSKDQDPIARISSSNGRYAAVPDAATILKIDRFQGGTFADTNLDGSGYLQLAGPKPLPKSATSELDYFKPAGMNNDGAGVIATDGTYLYVKAWSDYANTTTPQVYKKIGTGFNGTTRGQNYGTVGPATPYSISAFYWNGALYSQTASADQLFRVAVSNGATSTVAIPTPTLERYRGVPGIASLFACDGMYVYNLAFGINARTNTDNNGFSVLVLNPATGFSLVRQLTLDTDSYYTDGFFCDGTYIYPIEWLENGTSRIRRYRLSDGVREYEGTFTQTYTAKPYSPADNNPINGAWDPVNQVFWIGNLTNDWVHMLRAGTYHTGGTYTSAPLDSQSGAPQYGRLNWTATPAASASLSFKVRSGNTLADLAAATWYGPTGTGDTYTGSGTLLNSIHQKQRYLQLQATLSTSDPMQTTKLQNLGVEVLP